MKKFRGILSICLALMMVFSVMCCSASAANNSNALSDAISKAITDSSKTATTAVLTQTLHPTPENPLKYAYTIYVTASDPYGRAVRKYYVSDYAYMDFYATQADYKAGQRPIKTVHFGTDENGKGTVSYVETFTQDPPATLYFHVRPEANVRFTPASGTVRPMLYIDN